MCLELDLPYLNGVYCVFCVFASLAVRGWGLSGMGVWRWSGDCENTENTINTIKIRENRISNTENTINAIKIKGFAIIKRKTCISIVFIVFFVFEI